MKERIIDVGKDLYDVKTKADMISYELHSINSEVKTKYNYIIVSMPVYNVLDRSNGFIQDNDNGDFDDKSLRKVGKLGEFDVYLDIHLKTNTILLDWDKQTSRDVKLDALLNEYEYEKTEVYVVLNYYREDIRII